MPCRELTAIDLENVQVHVQLMYANPFLQGIFQETKSCGSTSLVSLDPEVDCVIAPKDVVVKRSATTPWHQVGWCLKSCSCQGSIFGRSDVWCPSFGLHLSVFFCFQTAQRHLKKPPPVAAEVLARLNAARGQDVLWNSKGLDIWSALQLTSTTLIRQLRATIDFLELGHDQVVQPKTLTWTPWNRKKSSAIKNKACWLQALAVAEKSSQPEVPLTWWPLLLSVFGVVLATWCLPWKFLGMGSL